MNQDMIDVIRTLLSGRQYVFSLFHSILGAEPTRAMLEAAASEESMQAIALFDSEDNGAAKALQAALLPLRGLDDAAADRIRMEYTRLFLGPEDLPAPPWESVYMTKERAIFQESMLIIRSWFQKYGYLPAGYPNFPDDHISLLVHFIELTCGVALERLAAGSVAQLRETLRDQKSFEEKHMLNWFPRYTEDMKQSGGAFYPAFAEAMTAFVAMDVQLIDELLAAVG